MKKSFCILFAVILILSVFSGCSSSPAALEPSPGPESASAAPETESGSPWPRTITDAAGHKITLETRPQRIALLHSVYLEYFLALESPPVASAGASIGTAMKALDEWETLLPYKGGAEIMDLGSAREINLEAVLEAAPDVIVTFATHGGIDEIYGQLTQVAPVILVDFETSWQEQTLACAAIVGKEESAQQFIAETEGAIATAKEALRGMDRTVALFRTNSGTEFVVRGNKEYYEMFGLTKPEGFPDTYETLSLEAVAEMNPDIIIFQDYYDSSNTLVASMEDSSVWQSLDAVKNGNIIFFDDSLNTFGPLALKLTAEKLMELAA